MGWPTVNTNNGMNKGAGNATTAVTTTTATPDWRAALAAKNAAKNNATNGGAPTNTTAATDATDANNKGDVVPEVKRGQFTDFRKYADLYANANGGPSPNAPAASTPEKKPEVSPKPQPTVNLPTSEDKKKSLTVNFDGDSSPRSPRSPRLQAEVEEKKEEGYTLAVDSNFRKLLTKHTFPPETYWTVDQEAAWALAEEKKTERRNKKKAVESSRAERRKAKNEQRRKSSFKPQIETEVVLTQCPTSSDNATLRIY